MKILRQTKDFTVYQLAIRGTLLQWLSEALNIPEDKVEEALQSKCFTEARIDEILKNFEENKENTARGWGNFFPTQEEGELSLVKIDWSSGWNRNRYPLGHPNVWVGEARLVLASSLNESTQVEAGNNALPPKRKESKKTANECACMKAIKIIAQTHQEKHQVLPEKRPVDLTSPCACMPKKYQEDYTYFASWKNEDSRIKNIKKEKEIEQDSVGFLKHRYGSFYSTTKKEKEFDMTELPLTCPHSTKHLKLYETVNAIIRHIKGSI